MSPIVEFALINPILQKIREELPELLIQIEDEYVSPEMPAEVVILVTGTAVEIKRFDDLVSEDPSVTDTEQLVDFDESKLVEYSHENEPMKAATRQLVPTCHRLHGCRCLQKHQKIAI